MLSFRVVDAKMDQENAIDLLHTNDQRYRGFAEEDILYFPKDLLRSRVHITLQGPKGTAVKGDIALTSCEQRTSLRYGEEFEGFADVAWSTITGHLSGCELAGDWWVRVTPMFGGAGAWAYDGRIQPNGDFSVTGNMQGVRHMLVVGNGKQPIKTVGVDVTVGIKNNEAGNIDLTGLCPK